MQNRLNLIIMTLAILMVCAGTRSAKAGDIPPGRWWYLPDVARYLQLTENEKHQLDQLFEQSRRALLESKVGLEQERFELEALMEKPKLDESAIMGQFNHLQQARSRLDMARFQFLIGIRKILGPQRYQQLGIIFGDFRQRKEEGEPAFNPRQWFQHPKPSG